MDLWDRLAGEILEYVENYCLVKSQSKIKPSYEVDYEINCLEELKNTVIMIITGLTKYLGAKTSMIYLHIYKNLCCSFCLASLLDTQNIRI